jgi:mannonate dehydratase
MKHLWRWFGPVDKVTLSDARQAGAQGIVSALHHIPNGVVWSLEEIAKRQKEIRHFADGSLTGLEWDVVESLPVTEAMKTQTGDWRSHIANYKTSLENLSKAGLETICYNFMPVLDWTRTDLHWRVGHGGTTMRFELVDFAAFDIHIFGRAGAENDFPAEIVEQAAHRFEKMSEERKKQLSASVNAGLPGDADGSTLTSLREQVKSYEGLSAERLRQNLVDFLSEVAPVVERLDMRLCCHPDDPPFPLLGLPRVMSTEEDYRKVITAVNSPAIGITLCTGSLGARADNDLPGMVQRLGAHIHFAHLRNVKRETEGLPCSFYEDEHLAGDTNMVDVVQALLNEEKRRRASGRKDYIIPMRPDHGQDILDDLQRGAQPGYPAIGRLKALAELRGVEHALSARVVL